MSESELIEDKHTIHLTKWLNVPRWPPWDRWGVPRGPIRISRAEYNRKLDSVFDFTWPATFWFMGKQFVGKSTGAEDIAVEFLECINEWSVGATILDFFSSDDDEGIAWIRSGYWPILLVCGDRVDLEYDKAKYPKLDWCHIGELKHDTVDELKATMKRLEQYKVVITVPSFYYNPNEMFRGLSSIIDLLKLRGKLTWTINGRRKILCLVVREAKVLLASRYWGGGMSSRQDAEWDLINLNDVAYHTGIALILDALRFTAITPEVRDIAPYIFLKRLGRTKIPREFNYILRYVKPRYLRRMPKSDFVLYTDTDDIYEGYNDRVDWHVRRGEGPLAQLGITPVYNVKAVEAEEQQALEQGQSELENKKWKVAKSVHLRIVKLLVQEGISFSKAQDKLASGEDVSPASPIHLSKSTLHKEAKAHRDKMCMCNIAAGPAAAEEETPE